MTKSKNEYIKGLNNPSKGFLVLLCYDVAFVLGGFKWALIISVTLGVIQLFVYANQRNYLSQFLVWISLIIVLATAWIYQITNPIKYPIIAGWIPQGLTVAALLTITIWRYPLFRTFRDLMKRTSESELRNQMDRLDYSVTTYLWALGIHQTIIIFILYFQQETFDHDTAIYLNYSIKYIALALSSLTEIGSIFWINHCLNKEEWIPIVAEDGSIKGKMAKALALTRKSKYRNPVVRIAFVYNDMLYLRPRPEETVFFKHMLDLPIGGYLPYGVEEKEYVNILLDGLDCTLCDKPRKMLRYIADGCDYKRLHYLYVVRVHDEHLFKNSPLMKGGKLWTLALIESNKGKRLFSDFFEQEFDFLLQTLFVNYNKPKLTRTDPRTIEAPL